MDPSLQGQRRGAAACYSIPWRKEWKQLKTSGPLHATSTAPKEMSRKRHWCDLTETVPAPTVRCASGTSGAPIYRGMSSPQNGPLSPKKTEQEGRTSGVRGLRGDGGN
ncbi:hypothetical protein NPIL_246051 [Nephila pilipes]|uniref:Uncharacterized protein n=1 Tax=Nephila pilipes TaxID=299642 RepID=A0A8X6ME78_NEPPI|nr:hypothetical protein NPIL_246051 [Nephila pilipes]